MPRHRPVVRSWERPTNRRREDGSRSLVLERGELRRGTPVAGRQLEGLLVHAPRPPDVVPAAVSRPARAGRRISCSSARGGSTPGPEAAPRPERGAARLPYVDERFAEELFRHKVLGLLRGRGLLSPERIELLLSWRRSGFSVHNRVYAHPREGQGFEGLVRYMMRSPVSLSRLRFASGEKEMVYARKGGHDAREPGEGERIDAEEFVARVLVQVPDPRRHLVRYYGAYSNRARGRRRKAAERLEAHDSSVSSPQPVPTPTERAALRRRWANLIRRVYEVDPLVCPRCGAEMRVISFITEPRVIRRILDHIRKRDTASRSPPHPQPAATHIA